MSGRSASCCCARIAQRGLPLRLCHPWRDSAGRIYCYLGDDLRLSRWALYPVLAAHFVLAARDSPSNDVFDCYPQGWTVHPAAGLAAYHRGDLHVYFPAAGGAITRIYQGDRLILEDLGVDIREGDVAFTARTYESGRPIAPIENGVSLSVSFGRTQYLFPSFLQRIRAQGWLYHAMVVTPHPGGD